MCSAGRPTPLRGRDFVTTLVFFTSIFFTSFSLFSLFHYISCQSSAYMIEWPHRPPPSRWTLADSMARSPTVSKSRPVPLIKSPKMDMMRYDRSSVTLAIKNKLHRSLVAQVPACSKRHEEPSKSQQHCSTSPPTCCSLKAYPNCAFASHAAEESISWQAPRCCPAAAQPLAIATRCQQTNCSRKQRHAASPVTIEYYPDWLCYVYPHLN